MTVAAGTAPAATREITITRMFDPSRALVWRAWVEREHLAQWWGPRQFTNPVCELDVRVGGAMRIDMRAPDGTVYPMTGTFTEIVEPSRLVFTAVARDHAGNALLEAHTIVTFEDLGGKTRLTVHARGVGIAPIAPQMLAGMEAGWSQSLDKLAELVAGM